MFPAYASTSRDVKEDGECDDQECEDSFPSFDQAKVLEIRQQRERRAKEKRDVERLKEWNTVRYIDSNSDEDESQLHVVLPTTHCPDVDSIDLPVTKRKKKKKSKHRKKRRKRKSHKSRNTRYSESSTSSDLCSESDSEPKRKKGKIFPKITLKKDKWDFLTPGEERSVEGSYIVFDRSYSHDNFYMDSIPQRSTPVYEVRFHTILNGNEQLNKMFFPKELRESRQKEGRLERYYSGHFRNIDEETVERKFRVLPSLCKANIGFVPLSKGRLEEFQFLHEIEECKAAEKERHALEHELAVPSSVVALETRRRRIASEFSRDSGNGDLLNQFLKINEEIFESCRAQGMMTTDRRPLLERQISILDQAIASNPRMVEYRLKRLHFVKEIGLTKELFSEWEKVLNVFVNNCSVWEKYLDFIQYDMAIYQSELMDRAFDRCFSKLNAILSGIFRSHKPEANTEVFLLNTYIRRLMWWMERGFTNRAVASVQATFEYNFFRPPSLSSASEREKMEAFSDFWNSGVPRIGDLEAKGWANYYSECGKTAETCDFEFVEQQAQMQQIYQLEEKIGSSCDGSVMGWVEMERELDNIESRPRRRLTAKYSSLCADELSNAQSEVTFADVRILTCCGDDAIFILLRLLGVHLNKSHSYLIFYQSYQLLTCAPTFHLLDEWNLMTPSKKLFTIPSAGARNIALNMIYGFFKIRPSMNFVATLLETKASQLDDLLSDRPTGIRITTMRDFLREFMTTFENVNTGIARVEFESAVAAYTLILFARWVREDNIDVQVPEHRASNEKKKKQKKIKKGDRQFTSSQYVEKLKEFVHKIIDTPLLMGSMQLQILLRTLLSLVQAVPHSSVLDIITRILLRKGYEEKLSPTDALAALNEWKRLFRTTEDFSKPISCFESPRALCIALRIHFDYARASQHSDQWVEQCEKLFELINHFEAPDDRSVILSAYLDVLEHNWKHRHTLKSKLLIALEKGRKICPHDSSVIRRYIDVFSNGLLQVRMHRNFFSENSTNDSTLDMYSSLALIYLEKLRIRRLQDAGVAVPTDVLARTARAEASRKFDPALWRLAIAYAQSKSFIDETHVLALAQCAWSRHLHIDYIAACGSREKCKDVIRLMEQRGARVFNYLDYIDVLGEPANLQP